MARVLVFRPADDRCSLCGEQRAAHRNAQNIYVGCPRSVTPAEIRARLRKTLARCTGITPRPFAIDTEVQAR